MEAFSLLAQPRFGAVFFLGVAESRGVRLDGELEVDRLRGTGK